jgi:hypothetical protein
MILNERATLKISAAVAAIGIGALGVAGCSSYDDHRGKGDAPVSGRHGDDSPAAVTNMPNDFPNVALKCLKGDAPWAAVVTTDRTLIVIQDPTRCGGEKVPGALMVDAARVRKIKESS